MGNVLCCWQGTFFYSNDGAITLDASMSVKVSDDVGAEVGAEGNGA